MSNNWKDKVAVEISYTNGRVVEFEAVDVSWSADKMVAMFTKEPGKSLIFVPLVNCTTVIVSQTGEVV